MINAAFQYLHFAQGIQNVVTMSGSTEGRELTKAEAEVYDSALTVLLQYFNEPNFGRPSMMQVEPPEEPEQQQGVPVA